MAKPSEAPNPVSPTIYDVARVAGVAASTVSRAFSRPGRVNARTAERIRRVADEMGYRTNPIARALLTGRSSIIALVIADITNPYYFEIIRGAQAAAAEAGYTMLLTDAQESDRLERQALDRALPTAEGIVLTSTRMSDSAIRMIATQRPTVVLNRAVADLPSVATDHRYGMFQAVDHLAGLGHDHFTYLAGPQAAWADGVRWSSLREVAGQRDFRVHRLGPYPPTVAGGLAAVEDFRRRPSSAVVAYNDLVALGFMRGLAAIGARVPGDISVVGFDNIFGTDLVTPGLTTVAAPLRTLGLTAVRNLLALIDGAHATAGEPVMLPSKLVLRESTGRRSRRRAAPAWAAPSPGVSWRGN